MPQKKNPDAWELLRGKTGRVTAALVSLLITLKGLPSSYQRDLQEDKEPVFAAHDQALAMVSIATGAVGATRLNESRLREAAADPALLATEAAHYLVRRGLPFRQAHEIVGQLVREAERARRVDWTELPLAELKKFSPLFEATCTTRSPWTRRSRAATFPAAPRRRACSRRWPIAAAAWRNGRLGHENAPGTS